MPDPTTTRKFGFLSKTAVIDATHGKSPNGVGGPAAYAHGAAASAPGDGVAPGAALWLNGGNCRWRYSSRRSTFSWSRAYRRNALYAAEAATPEGSGPLAGPMYRASSEPSLSPS